MSVPTLPACAPLTWHGSTLLDEATANPTTEALESNATKAREIYAVLWLRRI
jgi:hypothetical protein